MLECVVNVSEGRDPVVLDALADACGDALLDAHADPDHHRAVFTLATPRVRDLERAVRRLARAAAERIDLGSHQGVHPRLGAIDVVPFVALTGEPRERETARLAALRYADWSGRVLGVPAFLYGDADPSGRSLPEVRRDAFGTRRPDAGPAEPHPSLGATAVGARAPMVAVNCELAGADGTVARVVARRVRARDGGPAGVRALAFELGSRGRWQVSMNVTELGATGPRAAVRRVRSLARDAGAEVDRVELVGLVPAAALRLDGPPDDGIREDRTIEARLAARARGEQPERRWQSGDLPPDPRRAGARRAG